MSKRLFILAHARSGSTWLEETLNSHPEITMLNELLNPLITSNLPLRCNLIRRLPGLRRIVWLLGPASVQKAERKLKNYQTQWSGYKIIANQFFLRWRKNRSFFALYQGTPLIVLRRSNLVAAGISRMLATRSNIWHVRQNAYDEEPIRMNPHKFIAYLEKLTGEWEEMMTEVHKAKMQCLHLTYEELFADPAACLDKIADFLKVSPTFTYSTIHKKAKRPLQSYIANLDEIKEALQPYPNYLAMLEQ